MVNRTRAREIFRDQAASFSNYKVVGDKVLIVFRVSLAWQLLKGAREESEGSRRENKVEKIPSPILPCCLRAKREFT